MKCKSSVLILTVALVIGIGAWVTQSEDLALPVNPPRATPGTGGIRNTISLRQIRNVIGPTEDGSGLVLDLEDESLFGTIYSGPYPFEAGESDYDYMRFRQKSSLRKGRGTIPCTDFIHQDKINANDWPLPCMSVAYRLELYQYQKDKSIKILGFYDSVVSFEEVPLKDKEGKSRRTLRRTLTIIEGPFVSLLTSDDPTSALLTWQTDLPGTCRLEIQPVFSMHSPQVTDKIPMQQWTQCAGPDPATFQHEMKLTGLLPDTVYRYTLHCQAEDGPSASMGPYTLRTAPLPGQGSVIFAFASDSREGVGGGEATLMGHNAKVLKRLSQAAYRQGAQFFLFGGDLVNGYTTATEDFRLQMRAWKQSLAGFWRGRPVYPVMGNHEALLNKRKGISFDKWPYATDSAEAIFAEQFWNPVNGPNPSDARRPPYQENVYSFQYGPVLCIGYNNNYWWTTNDKCATVGGCPEGYLLDDQLTWIERELARAEQNPTIRYILVYAQEPVFPCGGHVRDCMWWNGDNRLRAHSYTKGKIIPEQAGMIEVRNRFWQALATSTKVATVLSGDEHEYHRLLVDDTTPVGVMARDDTNRNNTLDDGRISPNPAFKNPIWHITAGTAGAPYYAREETPWKPVILSSQAGYCLFEASDEGLSLTFYSITGQEVDHVKNLMDIKRRVKE
jgi:3',5'-cyclic AMP phosphodiesterase CpdA